MIIIKVNDSVEKSIKQWKRKFESTKILRELRERTEFKKKSVRKRGTVLKAKYVEAKRKSLD